VTTFESAPSSPYATGGGGVDLETEVVTYYLAAAVTRSIGRGLSDACVHTVAVQVAAQGEPLDDIVILGDRTDGAAKLSLQVKRNINFTEADTEFTDVVRRVWETVSTATFQIGVDAAGVAVGVSQRQLDEHYQRVLTWARTAPTGADFITRIDTEGLSHERQRAFVKTIRTLLSLHIDRAATDEDVWRFCKAFVILYFDFQTEGSRDVALTEATLRAVLPLEDAQRATDLRRDEWTSFFSDVLAAATATFDEATYEAIIGSYIAAAWQLDADLVPRYASAFLNKRLSLIDGVDDRDVNRWHGLVAKVLAEHDIQRFSDDYRNERVTDTLSLFAFVSYGSNYFNERWPHAHRFQGDITAWVSAVGHIRRAYRWLLVFLDRFSDRFSVDVVLQWLCLNGEAAPPVDMFADGDTGDRLAGVLLRIWTRSKREILQDDDMERRYASMIDHLLLAGITIANLLAERLARRE
jgi:hypothetical protein